jgi:hypothetical protein
LPTDEFATTFATDNLKRVMADTAARIKDIDTRLQEIDNEREALIKQREYEFHRQFVAKRGVGELM